MINHSLRCIFVQVPKTGSTSIGKTINANLQKKRIRPHSDIMQIKEASKKNVFDNYFKFGFVRNPWSRAVSLYHRNEGIQMKNRMSFKEFIKWHNYATDTCLYPTQKKYQLDFFTDSAGEILVNFIGRFENFQQDFNTACDKMGIPHQQLPHENKGKHKHYTEYYDDETRAIVAQKYAKDIEYFGYEFGE
jgi:hypothetical protein